MAARQLPVSSALGFSGMVVLAALSRIPTLVKAYALPGLATGLFYIADAWFAARASAPEYLPNWLFQFGLSTFAAVALVPIVRHFAMNEPVRFVPTASFLKGILWVALLHYTAWMLLEYLTSADAIYDAFLQSGYYGELDIDTLLWVRGTVNAISFGLSALVIALIYPLIGPAATLQQMDVWTVLAWQRFSFAGILVVTAILYAAIGMTEELYWKVLSRFLPDDLWQKPTLVENFDGSLVVLREVLAFPLDFLRIAISAVAIAKLVTGFGSAQESS